MYIFMKVFLRQIYSYNFHFFKPNNLKVIHDLYSQCLTQILSKTSSKFYMEGVVIFFQLYLMLHVCVQKFNVTGTVEIFLENK